MKITKLIIGVVIMSFLCSSFTLAFARDSLKDYKKMQIGSEGLGQFYPPQEMLERVIIGEESGKIIPVKPDDLRISGNWWNGMTSEEIADYLAGLDSKEAAQKLAELAQDDFDIAVQVVACMDTQNSADILAKMHRQRNTELAADILAQISTDGNPELAAEILTKMNDSGAHVMILKSIEDNNPVEALRILLAIEDVSGWGVSTGRFAYVISKIDDLEAVADIF